ncbi:Gag-Pol polyprotein [Plecturocebus cupreus]
MDHLLVLAHCEKGFTGRHTVPGYKGSQDLSCNWRAVFFSHAFLIMPQSPTPLLGWDLLPRAETIIYINVRGKIPFCCPLFEKGINPEVWAMEGQFGQAKNACPIQIKLNDLTSFPYQRQYPLRLEARKGLQDIVKNVKSQGLVRSYNSTCNTPILGV